MFRSLKVRKGTDTSVCWGRGGGVQCDPRWEVILSKIWDREYSWFVQEHLSLTRAGASKAGTAHRAFRACAASLAGAQDVPTSCLPSPSNEQSSHTNRRTFKGCQQPRVGGGRWAAEAWERGGGEVGGEVIRDGIQRSDRPQSGRASVRSTSRFFLQICIRPSPQPEFWGSRVSLMQTCLRPAILSADGPG